MQRLAIWLAVFCCAAAHNFQWPTVERRAFGWKGGWPRACRSSPWWKDATKKTCWDYQSQRLCTRDNVTENGDAQAARSCCACGGCRQCRGCRAPLPIQNAEQLETFGNYKCTTVEGELWIEPEGVQHLQQLRGIQHADMVVIRGDMRPGLEQLSGLETLQSTTHDLEIRELPLLTTLQGLTGLKSVGGRLWLRSLDKVQSLEGLENLTSVSGDLVIDLMPRLQSLKGLDNLEYVGGNLIIDSNSGMQSLQGLGSLSRIGGNILIHNLPALGSVAGADRLSSVGGSLNLKRLDRIPNLDGLGSLRSIGVDSHGISIWLEWCETLMDIDGLSNVTGPLNGSFHGRWVSSLQNVDGLLGVTSLGINRWGHSIDMRFIAKLATVRGFRNVRGDVGKVRFSNAFALRSMEGFEQLTSIRGLDVSETQLQTVEGFRSLTRFSGRQASIELLANHQLTSLAGLRNLTGRIPGQIIIRQHHRLESLDGLQGISSVGYSWGNHFSIDIEHCEKLKDFKGLSGLRGRIPGRVRFNALNGLQSLQGLEGVTSIGHRAPRNTKDWVLTLQSLFKLESLAGLSGLRGNMPARIILMTIPLLRSFHGLEGLTSTGKAMSGCFCESCGSPRRKPWIQLTVHKCPSLLSVAALGNMKGWSDRIAISAGSLRSLQGLMGVFGESMMVSPSSSNFCFMEQERSKLQAFAETESNCSQGGRGLVVPYMNFQQLLAKGTCIPCDPPCGHLPDGTPIECNYHRGECMCPLGRSGPGCSKVLPRVSLAPSQTFDCPLNAGHCRLSVGLLREASPEGAPGPARLTVRPEELRSASLEGSLQVSGRRLNTARAGVHYRDLVIGNVSWHNATHGEIPLDLTITRVLSNVRLFFHLSLAYASPEMAPDSLIDDTLLDGPFVTSSPKIWPWCLARGGGCQLAGPDTTLVTISTECGWVEFVWTDLDVKEDAGYVVVALTRVGGHTGHLSATVELDRNRTTLQEGVHFRFNPPNLAWNDTDTQMKFFAFELVNDDVWRDTGAIVFHVAGMRAVGIEDVENEENQKLAVKVRDDGDGGLLALTPSVATVSESAGEAADCLLGVERREGSSGAASVEVVLASDLVPCGGGPALATRDHPDVADGEADFDFTAGKRLEWADGEGGLKCAFGRDAARLMVYSDWRVEGTEELCFHLEGSVGSASVHGPASSSKVMLLDIGDGGGRGSYMVCDRSRCKCAPGWHSNGTDYSDQCSPCAPGHVCNGGHHSSPCPAGTFSDHGVGCDLCRPGKFQGAAGCSTCANCPAGAFSNSSGASECFQCSNLEGLRRSTTALLAASSPADCVCPSGSYLPCSAGRCMAGERLPPGGCQPCPKGFICSGGLEETMGRMLTHVPPVLASGYFASPSSPYCAIKCGLGNPDQICPGERPPGVCGDANRVNMLACGVCEQGYYDDAGQCAPCSENWSGGLIMAAAVLGAILCLLIVAFKTNEDATKKRHAFAALENIVAFGMLSFQVMTIFQQLTLGWISPLREILRMISTLFIFDPRILQLECSVSIKSDLTGYFMHVGIFPLVLVIELVIVLAKNWRMLLRRKWSHVKVEAVQALGTLGQVFFITMVGTCVLPFVIFNHYCEGQKSVVAYPNVFVGTSEHTSMAVIGITATLLVPLPFIAGCAYATWKAPSEVAHGNSNFIHCYRFLFMRYRHEVFHYGLIQLIRNLLVSMVPVIIADSSTGQFTIIMAVLSLHGIVQAQLQPWRIAAMNKVEAFCNLLLVQLLGNGALVTNAPDDTSAMQVIGLAIFILIVVLLFTFLLWTFGLIVQPRGRTFAFFVCHSKGDAGTRARVLQLKLSQQCNWPTKTFIDSDHLFNLDTLFETVRSNVRNLLVFLTENTLSRPWCAGEITTAVRNKVPITVIRCSDFKVPKDLLNMFNYEASGLAQYEITPEYIRDACEHLLGLEYTQADGNMGNTELEYLVGRIMKSSKSVFRSSRSAHRLTWTDTKPKGRIAILACNQDAEATAGACILHQMLLPQIEDGSIFLQAESTEMECPFDTLWEYLDKPRHFEGACETAVIVLSDNTLASSDCIALIALCMARFLDHDVTVVPVTLPGFRFPDSRYYEDQLPLVLAKNLDTIDEREAMLRHFFKLICVNFNTHGSESVIRAQALDVWRRMQIDALTASGQVRTLSSDQDKTRRTACGKGSTHGDDYIRKVLTSTDGCVKKSSSGGRLSFDVKEKREVKLSRVEDGKPPNVEDIELPQVEVDQPHNSINPAPGDIFCGSTASVIEEII